MGLGTKILWGGESELEVPPERIVVMGRSMGGKQATYLAQTRDCGGLVTVYRRGWPGASRDWVGLSRFLARRPACDPLACD